MTREQIDKSLIVPIFKNEENVPDLLDALKEISQELDNQLEVVFVIDGSPDNCYQLLSDCIGALEFPTQLISLSRNFGSFTAIRVGMEHANGRFIAVMAADLQEPPELITEFFSCLISDAADVVFGQRIDRSDGLAQKSLSNLYWSIYRRMVLPDIPKGGVDIFACNERVTKAVLEIKEPNSSLVAQLFWVGFRRLFIPYKRRKREKGVSGWTYRRKFRYMLDSIFSYSDFPILAILWLGVLGIILSITVGVITIFGKVMGWFEVPGYTTLILVGLFFGSTILATQGIIGCYLWRAFENTKKRPLSIIKELKSYVKDAS